MITITITGDLTSEQEQWLVKNIGPRMHWIHNSRGGHGWIAKRHFKPGMVNVYWDLTFEDERYATFFRLMFPE